MENTTLTITPEERDTLMLIVAAGIMTLQRKVEESKEHIIKLNMMAQQGVYPEKQDKEGVACTISNIESNTAKIISRLQLIQKLDLINTDEEKEAVEHLIAQNKEFQETELLECKAEFEKIFKLMEADDYNPADYRKSESDEERNGLAMLDTLLSMASKQRPDEKPTEEDPDADQPDTTQPEDDKPEEE